MLPILSLLTLRDLKQIIAAERPDCLLPNLGGQSGLNLCSELDKKGVLKKYNVEVIGVQVDAIERGEDRDRIQENYGQPWNCHGSQRGRILLLKRR